MTLLLKCSELDTEYTQCAQKVMRLHYDKKTKTKTKTNEYADSFITNLQYTVYSRI